MYIYIYINIYIYVPSSPASLNSLRSRSAVRKLSPSTSRIRKHSSNRTSRLFERGWRTLVVDRSRPSFPSSTANHNYKQRSKAGLFKKCIYTLVDRPSFPSSTANHNRV